MSKAASGDVIMVAANIYPGGITINKSLTLQGAGAGQTVLWGGGPVVTVTGPITVTIRGVTITGGSGSNGSGIDNESGSTLTLTNSSVNGNAAVGLGGGIYNGASTLTVSNSTITDNAAEFGGGITNVGSLTITNSAVTDNLASGSIQSSAGGIFNDFGTLMLTGTTVTGNTAVLAAGVDNEGGTATLTGSTVSRNTASADGGGIRNGGSALTLVNSTVSDNAADCSGGGIFNFATLTMTNSTVSHNTTARCDGGGLVNRGTLAVTGSTFAGNSASGSGGGIINFSSFTLGNSTFSGNSASQYGGGIYTYSGTVTLTNNTIGGNTANIGGGISINLGLASLANTLVAGNSAFYPTTSDCEGTFEDGVGGHNLIGNTDYLGCGLTDGQNGDHIGSFTPIDPLLGPLAAGGGPTPTMALLPGSPAIGAGDPSTCMSSGINNQDQRGAPRHADLRHACNIGAYDGGGVWYVDAASSSPSTSCQDNSPATPFLAIQSALTCAGPHDVISIAGSATKSYAGGLTLSQPVTLLGTGTVRPTIKGGSPVITVAAGSNVSITSVTISGGTGSSGGGIVNNGTLTLSKSAVSGNTASYGGGGIYNAGTLAVAASTIGGNVATGGGGGGGIYNDGGSLTVSASTISTNRAPTNLGGGLLTDGGMVTLVNSTISGNTAQSGGGGIYTYAAVTFINSTVSNNSASGAGGGIAANSASAASTTLSNTLVAGNHTPITPASPDCSGTLADGSGGHNLVGTSAGCSGLVNGQNGDQVGSAGHPVLPMVAALASNGGPTQTMALMLGSPAIDKGDNATCMTSGPSGVNGVDQRGLSRFGPDATCDIGAYEYHAH
jgi:hypothetical protein